MPSFTHGRFTHGRPRVEPLIPPENPGAVFESKRKTLSVYDPHYYVDFDGKTRRRVVQWGANVDFICWYLFNNPGARYSHVLRALCAHNGVKYASGQYSQYFNSGYSTAPRYAGRDRLWYKLGGGWILTLEGLARYGEWCA